MPLQARWTGLVGLALALACGSDSTGGGGAPVISTLQNDDFSSGSPAFQSGFVTGEAAAVRLGPESQAYTIRKLLLLFGGDTATKTVTLTIYADGGSTNPGTVLHSADYSLTGSDAAFREIVLTSLNIHVAANQQVRVAVAFQHSGVPSVALDAARTTGRNLVNVSGSGWTTAETLGLAGDFIIRAEISTP
jgi:hypothetical protein